jgi:hypothetical protein
MREIVYELRFRCKCKSAVKRPGNWWAGWDSNPLSVDYESTAYTN